MKQVYFAFRLMSGQFYFLPTFLYSWQTCKCWLAALFWGNIGLEVATFCSTEPPLE